MLLVHTVFACVCGAPDEENGAAAAAAASVNRCIAVRELRVRQRFADALLFLINTPQLCYTYANTADARRITQPFNMLGVLHIHLCLAQIRCVSYINNNSTSSTTSLGGLTRLCPLTQIACRVLS